MAEMKQLSESVPKTDPTSLTTAALIREIEGLRERTTHDLVMVRELIETRLNGNDQAVALLRTTADKLPVLISASVKQLEAIADEKFASIQTQFKERDTRTEQTSKDSKVAVDAALQAAKEAVGEQNKSSALAIAKSEAATTKQIDQIGLLIQNMAKALDDKIADIKDRLTAVESRGVGAQGQRLETNQSWMIIFGAVGMIVGIVGVVLVISKLVN